ncbi:MAG: ribosome biogenesis GTPase Der [Bacillota bacterium]|jgi:GTP-binding protein
MKPLVAIVGRANVGKSTLFNRLTGSRHAIVDDVAGVTRDRLYRDAFWSGRDFTVIDTGGIQFQKDGDVFQGKIKEQAALAIEEAHVIILVVDKNTGITADDQEVAKMLQKSGKPIVLAVNKFENFQDLSPLYEFYNLGLGEPLAISASHGMNTGDLLDEVVKFFPPDLGEGEDKEYLKIALIGRPNVGKSSLVNRLLGQERVIVSDVSGTTRDAIDTVLEHEGQKYLIIDTAGMRKKSKINQPAEYYSVARGLKAIERADIVLLVIDALDGLTEQDKRLAGYVDEAGKGLLIVVNKWDLPNKDGKSMDKFEKMLREELAFVSYALTVYVSAKNGQRMDRILPLVELAAEQHGRRIATSILNEVLREAVDLNPPPTDKGRRIRLLYMTQIGVKPPQMVIFVNDPEEVHFSYRRYIENKLRESFGFTGTPVKIFWRQRDQED